MSLWTSKVKRAGTPIIIPGLRFTPREAEGFLECYYGASFDKTIPALNDCGPYTLEVFKDGALFKTVEMPNHFWAATWWLDLTPVTALDRSPAFLINNNLVPPFGDTGIKVDWGTQGELRFPGPMGMTPGNAGYEPMTGGRPGIGIVTTKSAVYLVLGDGRDMMEQAKSGATQPIWFWDEATGKVIDLVAKPRVTSYSTSAQGGPPNWLGPFPERPSNIRPLPDPLPAENPSTPQTAHMEDVAGVAHLASKAPRYLRWLQMRVVKAFNEDAYWVGGFGEQVTIFRREMRGTAWLGTMLFKCYWATLLAEQEGTLPADCLASTVWKKIIDNQVAQFTKFIEPDPFFQTYGVWGGRQIAWWQCDMVNQMLGLYAAKWPAEWGPIYIKTLRNLAARVNADGKGQWFIAFPTWYWGMMGDDASSGDIVPYAGGYPELREKWFASQANGTAADGNNGQISAAQVAALKIDPTNGGTFVNPSEYQSWTFGALAYAVRNDRGPMQGRISAVYPNLEQAYSLYHAMMKKWVEQDGGYLIPQCSISVAPQPLDNVPPIVIPPPVVDPPAPPPVTPPPTGGTMTVIVQGQAYILTPAITKPAGTPHYGVKPGSWAVDKPNEASITPIGETQATAKLVAKIDLTVEKITASCLLFVDPAKTKTIVASIMVDDVLVEATEATLSIAAAPAG